MDRQKLAEMLKAFSDPTRLAIFDAVVSGTRCNSEIAEQLELSLSLVSHHLRFLEDAGLLRGQRVPGDARWICYTIDQEALARLCAAVRDLLDVRRIESRPPKCLLIGLEAGER
jgi:DNA-binding transcriptional ArsR family regulator